MKCDDIQLLLDEYLEGSLPAGDAARVKEHLKKCADCRDELQFLKKYMKKTETFPMLKAPDDFLEKIHRKIDAPERGTLIEKLFFPLKIKVPLEVAALLALAVTGLLLFKPFQPELTEYKAEKPGRQIAMEDKKLLQKETVASRSDSLAPVMGKNRVREKGIDPAADNKVAASRIEDMVASEKSVSEQLSKEKEKSSRGEQAEVTLYLKQNVLAGAEPAMDDSVQTRDQDRAEDSRTATRKSLDFAKKDKAVSEGAMQSAPSGTVSGQASIDNIASLARSLEGRIIKKTQGGNQVIVEIPRKNYSQFMKGLRGSWSVQRQYPAELSRKASKAEKVQFNINLQN